MRRPSQLTWLWWASMKITGMARYSTIWRRVTREIGDNATPGPITTRLSRHSRIPPTPEMRRTAWMRSRRRSRQRERLEPRRVKLPSRVKPHSRARLPGSDGIRGIRADNRIQDRQKTFSGLSRGRLFLYIQIFKKRGRETWNTTWRETRAS